MSKPSLKKTLKLRKQRQDYEKKRNLNRFKPSELVVLMEDVHDIDGNMVKQVSKLKRIKRVQKGLYKDYPESRKVVIHSY